MRVDPKWVKAIMRAFYRMFDRLPTDPKRIVFLSRQSDILPLDFEMLIDALRAQRPDVKVATVCRRLEENFPSKIRYSGALLRSLYYLATAKVCVLDSYWPAVSALDHKNSLVVFQMWHAMGKLKKSGKATVGLPAGRGRYTSEVLRIHEGYDYVVAGAPAWNRFYMESFGVPEDALLNIGLPRADYLVNEMEVIAKRILEVYPELGDGPVVLYAPTFRKGGGVGMGAKQVVDELHPAGFKVVVKGHANQTLLAADDTYWDCPEFTALEMLTVADYLVTDYSAISVEAALIDVRTFYYQYDFDDYVETNGLNFDFDEEVPDLLCPDTETLLRRLQSPYPIEQFERFKSNYVITDPGHSTEDLARAVFEKGGLCAQ